MRIGKKIKEAVSNMDRLTNKEFAEKLGTSENNVYKIFAKSKIDTDLLIKISKALKVSPAYFFEDDPDPEKYKIEKPGEAVKDGTIKAILQIELSQDKKDQVLKIVFGDNNLELLNK